MSHCELIFDLGFHQGEDTDHYLALGHQVVALEANRDLVEAGQERFASAIRSGQLTLVHAAVVGHGRGLEQVAFHPHPSRSEWGSVDLRWVRRNAEAHGLPHADPVVVTTVSLPDLVQRHGTPWLLKIDIEGADEEVLADLSLLDPRPAYVSWETGKESLRAVLAQHRRLQQLGYDRFRIVQQAFMERRPGPLLANGEPYRFASGASGPTPANHGGAWHDLGRVALHYRLLFLIYALIGPRSAFVAASRSRHRWLAWGPSRLRRWMAARGLPFPGWVDSHAAQRRAVSRSLPSSSST